MIGRSTMLGIKTLSFIFTPLLSAMTSSSAILFTKL